MSLFTSRIMCTKLHARISSNIKKFPSIFFFNPENSGEGGATADLYVQIGLLREVIRRNARFRPKPSDIFTPIAFGSGGATLDTISINDEKWLPSWM